MVDDLIIRRQDVETPLGLVHLAAFPKGEKGVASHRDVIYKILSQYTGRVITAENLTRARGLLDDPAQVWERPVFPTLDFDVNWTHSGKECVVAFGEQGSLVNGGGLHLGVDMEIHNPKRLRVGDRFYSSEEKDFLKSLADDATRQFFRLWCRKEALYKCVGGSFFEGAVGRNVLNSPLSVSSAVDCQLSKCLEVHFVDLPWDGPASLCIAVCRT